MTSKAQERRNTLHDRLIDLAETQIAQEGLVTLKARPLAQAAGCSVGAIYNVFDDLGEVTIAVNARTFGKLGRHIAEHLADKHDLPPHAQLIEMSFAYLDYAIAHPNLWRALFELSTSTHVDVPDWYKAELTQLFDHIEAPVRACFPNLAPDDATLLSRALFSSVHGIVTLGLENRVSGVSHEQIRQMITMTLHAITTKN